MQLLIIGPLGNCAFDARLRGLFPSQSIEGIFTQCVARRHNDT